jgi:hypothetical protein
MAETALTPIEIGLTAAIVGVDDSDIEPDGLVPVDGLPHVRYVEHWNNLLLHGLTQDSLLKCCEKLFVRLTVKLTRASAIQGIVRRISLVENTLPPLA